MTLTGQLRRSLILFFFLFFFFLNFRYVVRLVCLLGLLTSSLSKTLQIGDSMMVMNTNPSFRSNLINVTKTVMTFKVFKIFSSEYMELKVYLEDFEVFHYTPPAEVLERFKDGGVAIIDQWICAHAR